jgi:hypothetical protein
LFIAEVVNLSSKEGIDNFNHYIRCSPTITRNSPTGYYSYPIAHRINEYFAFPISHPLSKKNYPSLGESSQKKFVVSFQYRCSSIPIKRRYTIMVTDENASKGNERHPFKECREMFEAMSKCCIDKEGLVKCCSDMGKIMEIMRDKIRCQEEQEITKKE